MNILQIVDDLVDNINQNTLKGTDYGADQPVDRVSGYSLKESQRALDNCRNIDCWENNLRRLYNNRTEGNLTELFNYMRDARNQNGCD